MNKKFFKILFLLVLISFFISLQNINLKEFKSFIYKGFNFYTIEKAKEIQKDLGLSKYINIDDSLLNKKFFCSNSKFINDELKSTYKYIMEFDKIKFNNINTIAKFFDDNRDEDRNICLDIFDANNLYQLYHNVLIYDKNNNIYFIQLIEYDYVNEIRYMIIKDFNNSSNNISENYKLSDDGIKLKNNTIYLKENDFILFNFFDFAEFLNKKGEIYIRVPYVWKYYRVKIQKTEKTNISINDKNYNVIHYKLIADLDFVTAVFVNNDKNCLDLYFLDSNPSILIKYIFKYEINEYDFTQTFEIIF